jgi:hypothetical protein
MHLSATCCNARQKFGATKGLAMNRFLRRPTAVAVTGAAVQRTDAPDGHRHRDSTAVAPAAVLAWGVAILGSVATPALCTYRNDDASAAAHGPIRCTDILRMKGFADERGRPREAHRRA